MSPGVGDSGVGGILDVVCRGCKQGAPVVKQIHYIWLCAASLGGAGDCECEAGTESS